jgi:hypothetical protein
MLSSFKIISIFMMILILSSCSVVGDYYVLTNEKGEKSSSKFYSEDIFVYVSHFDGNISYFDVFKRNESKLLDVELVSYEHSLSIGGVGQPPASSRDNTKGSPPTPEGALLFSFTEVYDFTVPPKLVTEKIEVMLLVNEVPVTFSKEFPLKRVTYNQLQAIWGI